MATAIIQRQPHLRTTSASKGWELDDHEHVVVESIDVAKMLHDNTDPNGMVEMLAPHMKLPHELPTEEFSSPKGAMESFEGDQIYPENPLLSSIHDAAKETLRDVPDIVWAQSDLFGRNRQESFQVMKEVPESFWDKIDRATSGGAEKRPFHGRVLARYRDFGRLERSCGA
jgi:hypothetical protein